jgi:hypothetical protein
MKGGNPWLIGHNLKRNFKALVTKISGDFALQQTCTPINKVFRLETAKWCKKFNSLSFTIPTL